MPKPRKLRPASVRITFGTRVLNRIIVGAIILGRICRVSILVVGQPIALAASTYTFSLALITAALIILEPPMPQDAPITRITGIIPPAPIIEITTIRRIKRGMHIKASTNLCAIRSNLPPKYPDRPPNTIEMTIEIAVADKPTITETRAP
ncbi:unnamed protein product [marine sediment metagenome]|uniref:Uncharacterized protein n=1 Tax=marine sediment metagenome TaxID=412755 RepID=X1RIA1_9ZZZZ